MIYVKEICEGKVHFCEMFSHAEEFLTLCGRAIEVPGRIYHNPLLSDDRGNGRVPKPDECCETCQRLHNDGLSYVDSHGFIQDIPY